MKKSVFKQLYNRFSKMIGKNKLQVEEEKTEEKKLGSLNVSEYDNFEE